MAASLPGLMMAVILVTGLIYRELKWASFKAAVGQTTSLVMILVGCASAFSYLLAFYSVPEMLTTGLIAISDKPVVISLLLNLILLVLGMIMDMAALILICTPIFLPVATQFGMDPIQFGIIMIGQA
ncbi:TRAP transporter large permease subunit [Halomonas dongshanensis]|uniref:TRAP transporter large permease subunit n=1 Tax=Halomonas dongshanensis TaxID=2890835 RepID=A0ABT2ECM9_9GAMM|nr:TRAP transporter large permease subunit [Halomonas dongshanensis]